MSEFAFWTASIDSVRMVLMRRATIGWVARRRGARGRTVRSAPYPRYLPTARIVFSGSGVGSAATVRYAALDWPPIWKDGAVNCRSMPRQRGDRPQIVIA